MPYVKDEVRKRLDEMLPHVMDEAELAYVIARMAEELLWQKTGYDWSALRWTQLKDLQGVLHGAAVEFDRRVVAPYEDIKSQENGDVYEYPAFLEAVGKLPAEIRDAIHNGEEPERRDAVA